MLEPLPALHKPLPVESPHARHLPARAALDWLAAGSLTTKFVVPIPPLVGPAATVGNLVWSTDPEELRKMNEAPRGK